MKKISSFQSYNDILATMDKLNFLDLSLSSEKQNTKEEFEILFGNLDFLIEKTIDLTQKINSIK